jgi:type III secretion protein T
MPTSLLLDFQTMMLAVALVTPRTLVCLVILPGFSLRTLTGMARNGVAIAIALPAVLPTFQYLQQNPLDMVVMGMLVFKESMLGLLLGVLMAIPMWVAQSIGSIIDMQRSPIQIQNNNASLDQDASALGGLLQQAVVLVMINAGLFVALVRILIESYGTWPAFSLLPPFDPEHADLLIKRFGELFWHIVVYGGPVLIPLIMVDFAFAMLGVFASNLQVSFASSPIKSVLGVFMVLVCWPTFSHYVSEDFARLLDLAASLMQVGHR